MQRIAPIRRLRAALRARARVLWRAVRQGLDHAAYPLRRRRALARSRAAGPAASVLFVCLGNICRSPYAAAVFAREGRVPGLPIPEVASAGFIGPGRPSPPEARDVARARGLSLDEHVSQLLTPELVGRARLVVVMEPAQGRALRQRFGQAARHVVVLGDLDMPAGESRTIPDPFGQGKPVFEASFARVDHCVRVLARALADGARPSG